MSISNLPDQRTPARPVEINFAGDTGTPSANQEVCIIGHAPSGFAASGCNKVYTISNSGDYSAASGEVIEKFGDASCELSKMILAAIKANQDTGKYVALKAVPLASSETGFGTSDAALTAVSKIKAEFVVSPYTGTDSTTRNKLKSTVAAMSGPHSPANNQFGTFGVVFNRSVSDPANLPVFDSQYLIGVWLYDSGSPTYSIGEMAAAAAAKIASGVVPFNPLDDVTVNGIDAPADESDWPTVGYGKQSETALQAGWTPLRVKPNGEVAFVRTISGRVSADGSGTPVVTSYFDVQDLQVLYFWRKTLYTRFSQPDFKQRKASAQSANDILSEAIRLASLFEDQQMFQAVAQLSKQFVVERASSDRSRFNLLTPVNVVPGLHVISTNIMATTEFDSLVL